MMTTFINYRCENFKPYIKLDILGSLLGNKDANQNAESLLQTGRMKSVLDMNISLESKLDALQKRPKLKLQASCFKFPKGIFLLQNVDACSNMDRFKHLLWTTSLYKDDADPDIIRAGFKCPQCYARLNMMT
jgi:hypothetical protein